MGFCVGMTVWELSKRRKKEGREGKTVEGRRSKLFPPSVLVSFPQSPTHVHTVSQSVPVDRGVRGDKAERQTGVKLY